MNDGDLDDILQGETGDFEAHEMVSMHGETIPTHLAQTPVEAQLLADPFANEPLLNPPCTSSETLSTWAMNQPGQMMATPHSPGAQWRSPHWNMIPQPPMSSSTFPAAPFAEQLLPAGSGTLPPVGAYRTSSWPALDAPPHPPGIIAPLASVPPPPPMVSPIAFRQMSLPQGGGHYAAPLGGVGNPPVFSVPTTPRGHGAEGVLASSDSSQPSFAVEGEEDKSAGSGRSRRGPSSNKKVPLSNIAAIMTGINMGADAAGGGDSPAMPGGPSSLLKGPLRDPPRSKSLATRNARERMLQQNRMAQAKYRERQKERAVHMANELALRNEEIRTMTATLEEREGVIAELQARITSLETQGGGGNVQGGNAAGGVQGNGGGASTRLLQALRRVKMELDNQQLWIAEDASRSTPGSSPTITPHPRVHEQIHPAVCQPPEGTSPARSTGQGVVDPKAVVNNFGEVLQGAVAALLQHIHRQHTQQRTELMGIGVSSTPPAQAQALVHDWACVLYQLQLSQSQRKAICNLTRNTLHRLQTVRVKRQQLCLELERVVMVGALGEADVHSMGVEAAAAPPTHQGPGSALPTPQLFSVHGIAMPLTSTSVAHATHLLQALQATWQEHARLLQESNNLLLRHVLSAVQSARFLVLTYPNKCDAVQLGMMLAAAPGAHTGPGEEEATVSAGLVVAA